MKARRFGMDTVMVIAAIGCWSLGSSLIAKAGEGAKPAPLTPTKAQPAATAAAPSNPAPSVESTALKPIPATSAAPAAVAPSPWGYNFYVQPGQAGLVGAELYVSPRPTPPVVGHTLITYPPLAPHEFLYHHHRVYRTYNAGSGETKTRVRWN